MEKDQVRVAIYDEDASYSKRLMNYLNAKYGKEIDAVAFSKKEQLRKEIREYGFDCVVTADISDIGAVNTIRICQEEGEEGYYRYGSAKELAMRLLGYAGKQEEVSDGGKFVACYSVSTSRKRKKLAWKKAKETKGIYIGMEEFCTKEDKEHWMEELLFFIRNRKEDICKQLQAHLRNEDRVSYLPSARCFLDYRHLELEDYQWFFEKLSNEISKTMVFDIGSGSFMDFSFFSFFDEIYFLKSKDEEIQKMETMFLNLIGQEVPDIHEKIIFLEEEGV